MVKQYKKTLRNILVGGAMITTLGGCQQVKENLTNPLDPDNYAVQITSIYNEANKLKNGATLVGKDTIQYTPKRLLEMYDNGIFKIFDPTAKSELLKMASCTTNTDSCRYGVLMKAIKTEGVKQYNMDHQSLEWAQKKFEAEQNARASSLVGREMGRVGTLLTLIGLISSGNSLGGSDSGESMNVPTNSTPGLGTVTKLMGNSSN